ncbi:SSI family serine proteinase inhibitor [Sphaerisporangium sp. TRM90804]|uniref:SSI family serine proteinase inhibitor n=1 Tax=Sphaerisporangium sp. TRM90804 TaxID=3031113 RepID=UPI0024474457|nr:SSI family serine proteinase inhibitor [Sphaerisporangium sp. TRM90804]MDH2428720.1 SSI family serine proteinase inhibitor [Sphaerisporangium sp. TRM90804]
MCFGAALGLASPSAGAAAAGQPPPEPESAIAAHRRPADGLVLTRSEGRAAWPVSRVAVLQCSPTGGTHPRPLEACALLATVRGDLARLQLPGGRPCPRIYDPVTISAMGVWGGRNVSAQRTYGNACDLRNTLGAVGAF